MAASRAGVNAYGGVIECWKVELALRRIRRFGFPRHEWNDALQELVMEILCFNYDSDRANGATEATVLCSLINNQLMTMQRAKERRRRKLEEHMARLRDEDFSCLDKTPLCLDVQEAASTLTPYERHICAGLRQGDSVRQIARNLGSTWHAVKGAILGIRARFQAMGLEGWVVK